MGSRGVLRLRRLHAAVLRRARVSGCVPHGRALVLLPRVRRFRLVRDQHVVSPAGPVRPSRDEFRSLARDHTVVPVWREVLADLETPVSAFVKLVGADADGPSGFLLESVEHAERWGRFSFLGRDPACTLVVRGRQVEVDGPLPDTVPRDRGALAALEALLALHRAPQVPELPPFHGGVVGYLGYDVVREVERLPDVPPDDVGQPDAVLSVIGHVAAFDHWRQRLYVVENVMVGEEVDLDVAYDAAGERLDELVAQLGQPLAYVAAEPPDAGDPLPEVRSTMGTRAYADA